MAEDLNIVYRIAADITGLKSGVDKAAAATEGLQSSVSKMGTAIAGAFTIGAIEQFAQTVIGAASAFQKMADQTGLSTDEVQKLDFIAGQTDVSIGSLVSAVQNLQQRLGDDNSGAVGALAKLGFNAEAFNKLSTYEQVTSLSEAIRGVKDPTDQASLAAAVFGKNWKEILPAIKAGMKDVGDQAPIMSKATVEALNRIDDALKKARATGIAWGGSFVLAIEGAGFAVGDFLSKFDPSHFGVANSQLLKLAATLNDPDGAIRAFGEAKKAAAKLTVEGMEPLKKILPPTEAVLKDLNAQIHKSIEENTKAAEATKKAKDQLDKWNKSVEDATIKMNLSVFTLHRFGAIELPNVQSSLEGVDTEITNLASLALPNFETNLNKIGRAGRNLDLELKPIAVNTLPALSQAFAEMAQIGGPAFNDIARGAGQMISALNAAQIATKNLEAAQKAGTTSAGQYIQSLSSIVSVLFTVKDVLFQLIPTFGDFGNVKQTKNLLTLQDMIQSLGLSVEEFQKKVIAAGIDLKTFFRDTHDAKKFKEDLDALTQALQFQDEAMKFLDDTVKKYGFTIEELGPKFAQQKLTKQAFDLEKEFKALEAAGIDVTTISEHMKDAINDYLHAALKTGAAVPESMRAILQQLANMGLLTDENGNAITDLEAAGIHFSKTLDQQFEDLIKTINKLVDAIRRSLGDAIDSIPDVNVNATVHTSVDPFENTGVGGGKDRGGPSTTDIQAFATGGIVQGAGSGDHVLAMMTPGEMVLTTDQQNALFGSGMPIQVTVQSVLDGQIIAESTVVKMAQDKRGLRTKTRRALGVA